MNMLLILKHDLCDSMSVSLHLTLLQMQLSQQFWTIKLPENLFKL